MKEIYDEVYNKVERYDLMIEYKQELVKQHLEPSLTTSKIIDIGCGKGHYARNIMSWGYEDYLGVEFSTACSQKFLQDVPHVNEDFLEYGKTITENEYDVALCMDVVEHLPHNLINDFVGNIANAAPKAIIGVANHSDVFLGKELHLIQEGEPWWRSYWKNTTAKWNV